MNNSKRNFIFFAALLACLTQTPLTASENNGYLEKGNTSISVIPQDIMLNELPLYLTSKDLRNFTSTSKEYRKIFKNPVARQKANVTFYLNKPNQTITVKEAILNLKPFIKGGKFSLAELQAIPQGEGKFSYGAEIIDRKDLNKIESDIFHSVTDEDLKELAGAHTMNLAGCYNITDEGLKALTGIHTIDLIGCSNDKITDEGIEALAGVHTIDLTGFGKSLLSDKGVKALAGVHTINLTGCYNITDEGIKALRGVDDIKLMGCSQITDEGKKALEGAKIIDRFSYE